MPATPDFPPRIEPGKRYFLRTDSVSTGVRSLAYDPDAQTLDIEYPSGERYRYSRVPAGEFTALLTADSMGGHVNAQIKPRYPFSRL